MSTAFTCGASYGTVTITLNIRSVNVKITCRSHQTRARSHKNTASPCFAEDAAFSRFCLFLSHHADRGDVAVLPMAELSTWESRRPFIGERIFSTGVPKQSATKPIIWPRRTLSPTAATAEYRPERFAYIHSMLSYICGRPTGQSRP